MNHNNRSRRYAGLKVILAAMCCGTSAGCYLEFELIPVHGQVLFQGEPLQYGSVMFQPQGEGPLARGTIQADGTFVLGTESEDDGVRPGNCRVRITAFEAQRVIPQENHNQEIALGQSAIPAKYQSFGTSGVAVEITPELELPLVIELD
ncbi:MAG: hypothetical protein ABGX16_21570 [Pirellulales bacterium]